MEQDLRYEPPVLIDAAELAAASRPERIGVCLTGGGVVHEDEA